MATRNLGHAPALAETRFNNANLLRIRPAPTATGIGDGKDGRRRMLTFNGRIEEVLQSHHFPPGEELETTLHRYKLL